jgi:chaperonin GroEL
VFNTVAVKAPAFGDRRKEMLQDLAILTGATVISTEQGVTFEDADLSMVGSARKVIVTKDETTIIEGAGSVAEVKERIAQVRAQAAAATSEYDKENYEKRAAALGSKVAVIKVGGTSEVEIEEAKFRVDDAVAATKAALEEGIVAGGGVTLANLSEKIVIEGNDSKTAGRQILRTALLRPFYELMHNSGLNPDEWWPQIRAAKAGQGIDVTSPNKLVDLKAKGIVDPARVTKEAIMNAVSIAATAMTMGALVVDIPEKDAPAGPAGGGMPGMGMM